MKFLRQLLIAATCAVVTASGLAQDFKAGAIDIQRPYARATGAGQAVGGGFVKFNNGGAADRLLSARSEVSNSVELHTMRMEGDVMRMRQVDAIELPAGQTVELKPGGLHLMFIGLKGPLKVGESFPVTLKFEKAGEVTVQVKVEPVQAAPGMMHKH